MRAERRLRRLERGALERRAEAMSAAERADYLRLLRRVEDDGLDAVSPEEQERVLALLALAQVDLAGG